MRRKHAFTLGGLVVTAMIAAIIVPAFSMSFEMAKLFKRQESLRSAFSATETPLQAPDPDTVTWTGVDLEDARFIVFSPPVHSSFVLEKTGDARLTALQWPPENYGPNLGTLSIAMTASGKSTIIRPDEPGVESLVAELIIASSVKPDHDSE